MTDKTKHTPLPWCAIANDSPALSNSVQIVGGDGVTVIFKDNFRGRDGDIDLIIDAVNAYYPNKAFLKNLISAFEPILELAKRKADYPAELGMVTRADNALEAAKEKSDE